MFRPKIVSFAAGAGAQKALRSGRGPTAIQQTVHRRPLHISIPARQAHHRPHVIPPVHDESAWIILPDPMTPHISSRHQPSSSCQGSFRETDPYRSPSADASVEWKGRSSLATSKLLDLLHSREAAIIAGLAPPLVGFAHTVATELLPAQSNQRATRPPRLEHTLSSSTQNSSLPGSRRESTGSFSGYSGTNSSESRRTFECSSANSYDDTGTGTSGVPSRWR